MIQKLAFVLAFLTILAAGFILLEKSIQNRIDRAMKIQTIYIVTPATEGRA